jgi:hypothetical protein
VVRAKLGRVGQALFVGGKSIDTRYYYEGFTTLDFDEQCPFCQCHEGVRHAPRFLGNVGACNSCMKQNPRLDIFGGDPQESLSLRSCFISKTGSVLESKGGDG